MSFQHQPLRMIAVVMLACSLFSVSDLSAQQRFSASLTGGVSFPTGRFGDQLNAAPTAFLLVDGGASTGWNGNLKLGAALTPRTWITVTAGLSRLKGKNETIEKTLNMIYGYEARANAGTWSIWHIVAGPSFRLPVGRKLSFRPSIAAGIAKTAIPALTYTTYSQGGNPLITLTHDKIKLPATFAYQVSLGCAYSLATRLRVVSDVGFFAARAKYDYYPITQGASGPEKLNYEYPLNHFSLTAGVELSF